MSSPGQPPPEGALLRLARKARGLSVKKAAALVRERAPDIRLGESRWYHIESGTEGKDKIVTAPEETLAHMAYVVGLTGERLRQVNREDAAEILDEIYRQLSHESTAPAPAPDPHLRRLLDLWPQSKEWQRRSVVGLLEEMVAEQVSPASRPDERRQTG